MGLFMKFNVSTTHCQLCVSRINWYFIGVHKVRATIKRKLVFYFIEKKIVCQAKQKNYDDANQWRVREEIKGFTKMMLLLAGGNISYCDSSFILSPVLSCERSHTQSEYIIL